MATRPLDLSSMRRQIDRLRSTMRSLLHEVDANTRPVHIDAEHGIDFYESVARYEAELIESALHVTGGRQNRAADLLRLRKSTLNSKMKQLKLR